MDPSAKHCLMYDTLKVKNVTNNDEGIPWYSVNEIKELNSYITYTPLNDPPVSVYADSNKYNTLNKIKNTYSNPAFEQARNKANPFENIGRSIFINRAAIKLANIDAVFNITPSIFTFDKKQSDVDFTFVDVAAGPGGFTQYLQYRYPNSKGYGMTLKSQNLDWNRNVLDMKRFIPYYGVDDTGDLYYNWEYFVDFVIKNTGTGVDLVTADGGFELDNGDDQSLYQHQEFLSSRLLLTQAIIGLACTKFGGNFVLKLFDTVTEFSAQLIYLIAQSFQKITIFKPVTSRPANSERYLICINKTDTSNLDILRTAGNSYSDHNYLGTLFSDQMESSFILWLSNLNQQSIDTQLQSSADILKIMNSKYVDLPKYDSNKFLTIWNLPDTPPNRYQPLFKRR